MESGSKDMKQIKLADEEMDKVAGGANSYAGRSSFGKGIVKFYSEEKGFGRIGPDDGSRDVYVHYSAIQVYGLGRRRSLKSGDKVSYELSGDPYNPKALKVVRIE